MEAVPGHRVLTASTPFAVRPFSGSAADVPRPDRSATTRSAGGVGVRRRPAGARARLDAAATTSLDAAACAAAGVEVVRRRSGGGVVLLEPGGRRVVRRRRAGRAAARRRRRRRHRRVDGRGSASTSPRARRPRGRRRRRSTAAAMACSAWCPLVCFAGVGPGEVLRRRPQARRHQPAAHPRRRRASSAPCTCAGRPSALLALLAGAAARPARCRRWPRCPATSPRPLPGAVAAALPCLIRPIWARICRRSPGRIAPRRLDDRAQIVGVEWGVMVDRGGNRGAEWGPVGTVPGPQRGSRPGRGTRKGAVWRDVRRGPRTPTRRQGPPRPAVGVPGPARRLLLPRLSATTAASTCTRPRRVRGDGPRHDGPGPQRRDHPDPPAGPRPLGDAASRSTSRAGSRVDEKLRTYARLQPGSKVVVAGEPSTGPRCGARSSTTTSPPSGRGELAGAGCTAMTRMPARAVRRTAR